ncbi:MAG: hypothetical protein EP303_08325 [Deltaproteobacteria bacterium]|nr:MAG: hypothetical protein EP303_08325 [Deltaproteobacteria bacterium]
MAPEPEPIPGVGVGLVSADGRAKKLQWSLNDDGTLYFRLAMWLQVWTRAIQLAPGTTVQGDDSPWYGDVGLRRARFLAFGQIFPRTFLLMHIGINNQTFRNARKPQVFFHDAWVEFQVSKNKALSLGGGLIYWNGISRQTNASTITAMSLDLPIMNWPLIEREDQFARQLGLYAKGKFGLFDYRVAVTRPFTAFDVSLTSSTPAPPPTAVGNYRDTNAWAYAGYFMFQFLDEESNVLPYTVGTYIGAKKVFNFGFGGYVHPWGVWYGETDETTDPPTILSATARTLVIGSGDLFLDIPFGGDDGGAATWYGVYQYQDFGPNNVRPVGIMNPADAGSGAGNAYPMIGTGHHVYSELGILIPGHVGQAVKFQPYVNWQGSSFQGLNDAMHHIGVGLNTFIHRHNAKVTIEYRNRPIYDGSGNVANRKGNSFVLQMHLFIYRQPDQLRKGQLHRGCPFSVRKLTLEKGDSPLFLRVNPFKKGTVPFLAGYELECVLLDPLGCILRGSR